MDTIEQTLASWKGSLVTSIPVAGLISRNRTAYKWKAPFRVWMLREAVLWRLQDLLSQSYALHQQRHGLGARILLRSAFETLAILIHLNQLMQRVVDGDLEFFDFSKQTSILLLGSRNDERAPRSLNIMTVLEKCDRRYRGMMHLYADLSESAHPNFEGLCAGYSTVNRDEYETIFSNRWVELHGDQHLVSIELCMTTFSYEYNDVWSALLTRLEKWLEENDDALEAAKDDVPE